MVASCFALGCSNRQVKGTLLTFHRMPRNRGRAMQWLKALGREDIDFSKLKHVKLCCMHFDPNCFINNHRGKTLLPGTYPTLNLGRDSVFYDKNKKRKKRVPLNFGEYSEEQIKKSPREALRAFRLAKIIIQHKSERIRELATNEIGLQKRLLRCQHKIDQMHIKQKVNGNRNPVRDKKLKLALIYQQKKRQLGLNLNNKNLKQDLNRKKQGLPSKPGKNTKTCKTPTVKIKEEPLSESDEEPNHSESDKEPNLSESDEEPNLSESDEEPTLPDSEADSSDLMDEDEWAKTFREDPESPEDEALGIPVQGGLTVGNTSPRMPVIQSVSSLRFPSAPTMQSRLTVRGILPTFTSTTPIPIKGAVTYGAPIIGVSKSTQTDTLDSENDSTTIADSKGTGDGPVSYKIGKFDSFGDFVARRLNALEEREAVFLQEEFGTLMYKLEKKLIVVK